MIGGVIVEIESLADKLESWMQFDTWYTSHHLDEERFNKALQSAFREFGNSISFEQFKLAMEYLVSVGKVSKLEPVYLKETIEDLARKGEIISSYLYDTEA